MDSQQPYEEAKAIDEILKRTAYREDETLDPEVFLLLLSGMMTETLIEYEEPDAVMEQSFHRISQLLHVTPVPDNLSKVPMPSPIYVDMYTEAGREIAREAAERLEKGLDEVHEIVIAIAYNELPNFEKDLHLSVPESLRMMIEAVIQSLVYEMATQEFADVLIEEFISDGWSITEVLLTLGATCGYTYALSMENSKELSPDEMVKVMSSEGHRHGLSGSELWPGLDGANDGDSIGVASDVTEFKDVFDEFFDLVGFEAPALQAVAIAKTAGRMAALVSGAEMNYIQPSLAKVLLKTGLSQGLKLAAE